MSEAFNGSCDFVKYGGVSVILAADAAVDAGRDDDDVPGLILILLGCGACERVLSVRYSPRCGGTHRH